MTTSNFAALLHQQKDDFLEDSNSSSSLPSDSLLIFFGFKIYQPDNGVSVTSMALEEKTEWYTGGVRDERMVSHTTQVDVRLPHPIANSTVGSKNVEYVVLISCNHTFEY